MARELVNLSIRSEDLAEKMKEFDAFKSQYQVKTFNFFCFHFTDLVLIALPR
jgi:hypothetical protein